MTPEQRSAFEAQHSQLRAEAEAAGLDIPPLGACAPAEAPAAAPEAAAPAPPAQPAPGDGWKAVAARHGVKAEVEEGDSGECVFRFGGGDAGGPRAQLPWQAGCRGACASA